MTVWVDESRARRPAGREWMLLIAFAMAWASACSSKRFIAGEQCPAPFSGRATVEGAADAGPQDVYGTSCAPCEGAVPHLDARGCPIFVTFASCGGDICIGDTLVARLLDLDAGSDTVDGSVAGLGGAGE